MKKLARVLAVFSFAAATMTTQALVPVPTSIVVDEFGVGTIGGAPLPPGVLTPDPFNGGALHLAYTLPFAPANPLGGPGFDVVISEPGGQFSDILRFVSPGIGGPGTLFFYSDGIDGLDAPADVLVLPPLVLPVVGPIGETGIVGPGVSGPYSEAGPNGLVYFAAPGAPGSDGNPGGTTYTFISDVPEPGTFALVGLGAMGLLAIVRRRKA